MFCIYGIRSEFLFRVKNTYENARSMAAAHLWAFRLKGNGFGAVLRHYSVVYSTRRDSMECAWRREGPSVCREEDKKVKKTEPEGLRA